MPQGSDTGPAPVLNRLILRLVDRSSETVFLSLAGADGFDKSLFDEYLNLLPSPSGA